MFQDGSNEAVRSPAFLTRHVRASNCRSAAVRAHSRHAETTVRAARHAGTRRRGDGRQWARRSRGLTTRPGSPSSSAFRPRPSDASRLFAVSVHVPSARIEGTNVAANERLNPTGQIANSIRFPFKGFTYFLTLFSKSFSPFPHGTCSLSVSGPYLALDGVYHPFWTAFPNSPTLRKYFASARPRPRTGLSPSTTCFSKQFEHGRSRLDNTSRDYNSPLRHNGDLQVELIPLHSPLLRESWLVSFPPLSNMLKFSW